MMLNSGFTASEAQAFYDLIRSSHRVEIIIHLMDNKHNVLADVSYMLISGQVDMDANADITRSAKLSLLDPGNVLGFDYPSGGYGQNYYNRMFRVYYRMIPLSGTMNPVTFPLFTGPVTDVDRDGPVYDIECQGKEVMATEGFIVPWSWPAGWPKSRIMVNYLRDYLGEDFTIVEGIRVEQVIAEAWAVDAGEDMWARFKEMANGFNYQLYYDAWGNCKLSPINRTPVFEFNETMMTGPANVAFDIDNLTNCVRVVGGTPQGLEGRYIAEAYPPASNPLSPQALSRSQSGIPRYMPEFIEDDSLLSQEAVDSVALTTLADRMISSLDVTFTSMVVPHLEEFDMIQVNSSRYWGWVRHSKQSIPLVGDGEMSVGFMASSSYAVGLGGGVPSLVNSSADFTSQQDEINKLASAEAAQQAAVMRAENQAKTNKAKQKEKVDKQKEKKINAAKKKKPKKGNKKRGEK